MNSMNQSKVDEELKKLAMDYIKATNANDHSTAENILHDMEVMKNLMKEK